MRVRAVRIFKPFHIRTNLDNFTTEFEHHRTRFMCNFGTNSLEIFIKATLDSWVRTLEDQVWVPLDNISVKRFKNDIRHTYIWITGSRHQTFGSSFGFGKSF